MENSQEVGSKGGRATGSKGTNPSCEEKVPATNQEHNSWVGINAADPYLIEPVKSANGSLVVRQDSGEPFSLKGMHGEDMLGVGEINELIPQLSNNGRNKERNWISGKGSKVDFFQFGQSQNISPKASTKAKPGNLPQKFVGQWDAGQNKMIWHSLQEGGDIQLEKDPVTNTYVPRVGKETSFSPGQQGSSHPHMGLSSKTARQQAKKTPLKSPVSPKPTTKRSRSSTGLNKSHGNQSGLAGKRKLIDEEDEDEEEHSKTNRKSELDDRKVQAGAGSQPRRQP